MSILSIILYILLGLLAVILLVALWIFGRPRLQSMRNLASLGPEAPVLTEDGITFRDLNKNGKLDVYEDPRRPIEERVEDLLSQMTLEEKAGLMMHTMISPAKGGEIQEVPNFMNAIPTSEMVVGRHMRFFNIVQAETPELVAKWYNKLQKMVERTRLGIPVTISTDPRHSVGDNPGAGMFMEGFSHWPGQLGLAATRDEDLVYQFGDIGRQEYIVVGIRAALHPMADLGTEPRWARYAGTFGEDAELSAKMIAAYIKGFQGEELGHESVSCMVKHWPGGGPQKEGLDPHFAWGKEQVYPGNNFDYHLIPFKAAFEAGVAQVMPYYGVPMGQTSEDVGMAFNKEIITDMLRGEYGFDGIICSDWQIAETNRVFGLFKLLDSTSWGVEHLTPRQRYAKALNAGIDQFGGQASPHQIVALVRAGEIAESRIDASVRRLLHQKFQLGLFDDPYVDEKKAREIPGNPEFRAAGELAQRKSIILLKNADAGEGKTLPLSGRPKLYVENMNTEAVARYADVVDTLEEADFAILRLMTPYEPREGGFLERFFHHGDLDFKGEEKERILNILKSKPTIVDIFQERPAVIPEITAASAGLLSSFGVSDEAVLDVIFGKFNPTGKLPFEMPSSMEAVRNQKEDVPYDSENPLFEYGFGLSYE